MSEEYSGPRPSVEEEAADLVDGVARLRDAVRLRIVGQESAVEEVLLCLLAGGHGLLEGVPGLAKTLLVHTVADALDLDFRRVQFTPDLMPGDITGTEVIEEDRSTGRREIRFIPGPVFTHMLLADEINRAPPKTQAALLEAMQERRVTTGGETRPIEDPFLVLATQNPIEQEGTYPLPEAQLDRFLLKIRIGYPEAGEEVEILQRTTGTVPDPIVPVLNRERVLELRALTREIAISNPLLEYAVRLSRATRPGEPGALEAVVRWLRWGAGPRAGQALVLTAKARALLAGRLHVTPEDIRAVARPVLRHRILLSFRAEAEGQEIEPLLDALLEGVRPPSSGIR